MEPERNIKLPRLERKKRRKIRTARLVILLIFFLFCAWLGYMISQLLSNPFPPVQTEDSQALYNSPDILNILILGIDQRENESARADTIILASFDLKNKAAYLLSIPRDTRVAIPEHGVRKINSAHAFGGIELTVKTVEQFLDLPVHYYVETNFEGFSRMIDILGGVTLNVEQRMYYPDENIDLQVGLQKLNGEDALSYVRWRSDGRGDIGRIERQQKFFRALSDQALCFSTIWKIPELLGELNKQVNTDMKLQTMIVMAKKFRDLENIKISTSMVPGVPDEVNYGGSYWIADKKALSKILEEIYGSELTSTVINKQNTTKEI